MAADQAWYDRHFALVATLVGVVGFVLTATGGAGDGGAAAITAICVGLLLLIGTAGVAIVRSVVRSADDRRWPELGARRNAWRAVGAGDEQLDALEQAHLRQRRMRSTSLVTEAGPVRPLADAFAICRSPAWRDPWLTYRRLQIDPVAEACEIVGFLDRVAALMTEARARSAFLPPDSMTAQRYVRYQRDLHQAYRHAAQRAEALHAYRVQVDRLAALVADQSRLAETEAFGERVRDLLAEGAGHDVGRGFVVDSTASLQRIEQELRAAHTVLASHPLAWPDPWSSATNQLTPGNRALRDGLR